jgi:nickel/cobalt exporter
MHYSFKWLWFSSLITVLLVFPQTSAAHPLDEFYQVTYITVAANRITLQVEQYTGVLIAPQVLKLIDADQDDLISETEREAFVNLFLKDITFEIDGQLTPLTSGNLDFSTPLDLRAGVGVIRFSLSTDLPPDHHGNHQLYYKNSFLPDISVYLVNAISDAPRWVNITKQDQDIFQSSLRLSYTIEPGAPIDVGVTTNPAKIELPGGASGGQEWLAGYLYDANLSPLLLAAALGLAALLGGLHALTPGHGKSLVAAYLIGSRGTTGHAITLGSIVTFTHTASVIVIGLLALLASQFIVPRVLAPALEILSGLLVVMLGLQLLWKRWRFPNEETHHHDHHHDHDHPLPEQVTLNDLLTLGISGGLVPCPEALGVMLLAIGLNRILLGLGLIVAFSFGLAAVLIVIGILLVRSKALLDRLGGVGGRWQKWLPLASAVVVTMLGLGIVVKGILTYVG